jgi:hypothetical protein
MGMLMVIMVLKMVLVVVVVVVILFINVMTMMKLFFGLLIKAHSFSEYIASRIRMMIET